MSSYGSQTDAVSALNVAIKGGTLRYFKRKETGDDRLVNAKREKTEPQQYDYFFGFGTSPTAYEVHFHATIKGATSDIVDGGTMSFWTLNKDQTDVRKMDALKWAITDFNSDNKKTLKAFIATCTSAKSGWDSEMNKQETALNQQLAAIQNQKAADAAKKKKQLEAAKKKAKDDYPAKVKEAQELLKKKGYDVTKYIKTKDGKKYVWEKLYQQKSPSEQQTKEKNLIEWYIKDKANTDLQAGAMYSGYGDNNYYFYDDGDNGLYGSILYDHGHGDGYTSDLYYRHSGVISNNGHYSFMDPMGIVLGLVLLISICCIATLCGLVTGCIGGYVITNKLEANEKRKANNINTSV
eukprot:6722_1